jgi:acyl-[acyl-carrier-protein]-phospholipid O-acyltransferase/long-chain-fatty-acid--[acyl-carrier-protein] ligase
MDLLAWAHNHGVSELAVPRKILVLPAIPVMGTGKTDYVALEKLAQADLDKPAG